MPSQPSSDRKNSQKRFKRRANGIMKKAHQLSKLCSAEIAIIIKKEGRYYTFRSTEAKSWPPSMEEIVRSDFLRDVTEMLNI
jgi:hypothetical protein